MPRFQLQRIVSRIGIIRQNVGRDGQRIGEEIHVAVQPVGLVEIGQIGHLAGLN